jgi:hypothetical protein
MMRSLSAAGAKDNYPHRNAVDQVLPTRHRSSTSVSDTSALRNLSRLIQAFYPTRTTLCLGAVFFLLCVAPRAGATTLSDYRHRISQALVAVQQLQLAYPDGNSLREQSRQDAVKRLRVLLPAKEAFSYEGRTIAIDNSWLHEDLDEYEKSIGSAERSNLVLTHIGERLLALGQRLDEKQIGTDSGNKDEAKGRLAEILRRSEYNQKAAEDSAIGRLWDRFLRWLASLFPETKPIQPGSSRAISGIAQILVIGVGLLGIAFLIWKFLPRYLRDRRGKKKTTREARIVLGERLEPDQTAADLLAQAEALARTGDLRAAIRKAYIAFLCELGDRKVISLAQHKTNRDYLNSVREKGSLHSTMRGLTNSFEVHWYGFVSPGENDWNDFRQRYQQALKTQG